MPAVSDSDDEAADRVVSHVLAASDIERTRTYLAAGRRFGSLSDAALADEYVAAFRAWAEQPKASSWHSEVSAEYALRGREPPNDLVADEMAKLIDQITATAALLTEEQKDDINADLMDEYLASLDKKQ